MRKIHITFGILLISLLTRAQHLDSLLRVWQEETNIDTVRIDAVHEVAWKLAFSNPDSSITLATLEFNFAQKKNIKDRAIYALNTLGVASTIKGEYIHALDYYENAINQAKSDLKNKDARIVSSAKKGLAQTYINRGILYKNQGDYVNALNNQLSSLAIWEELNAQDKIALSYVNIGIIYKYLEDYEKALDYQMKSVELRQEIGNLEGQASAYSNIGTLLKLRGELDSALIYYKKSLDLELKKGNPLGISASYHNIGNLYFDMGNVAKAIDFQKKSLSIDKTTGSKKGMASSYVNLGEYYLELKQYSRATSNLSKGLELAVEIGSLKEQKYARKWLHEVYEEKGDFKTALYHYKQYILIQDSLVNENTHTEITRSEIRFEFEKKNYTDSLNREVQNKILQSEQRRKDELKEAELRQQKRFSFVTIVGSGLLLIMLVILIILFLKQKKNNTILSLQKSKIEKSDKEKEVLIREIHHRVKNNLQIISSLLKSEQRKTKITEVNDALAYSRQRIEAISLVHEKLYLQTDLTSINLEEYLMDLAENLLISYDKLEITKLDIRAKVTNLHVDIAVNFGLLVAELITNSIKHGFESENEDFTIEMRIKENKDLISFAYTDNGKGMGASGNIETGNSFGMKMIRSIIKKMNGEIVYPTELKSGFNLFFDFKLKADE
jgi:two-component sensor histidine kinase/Tfp pilus assembly protein PilF